MSETPASISSSMPRTRHVILSSLSLFEDVVYIGLGILLAVAAATLLVGAFKTIVLSLLAGDMGPQIVAVLDTVLLILLIIELLYTVQVSFREHGLVAEPFLIVALISVVRRILIITAEVPRLSGASDTIFHHAIIELGLLTVMVFVLVVSFIFLQRNARENAKSRSGNASAEEDQREHS